MSPRSPVALTIPPTLSWTVSAVRSLGEGDDMTNPTYVDKAEILATLRSRGLHARADWVDRQLPELVDTYRNAALLRTLDIDPASMSPAIPAAQGC